MAERKAVNRYYPPDWDPTKGSINKYVGQHPLRDRARKLNQGILVIRFEMPYNIWCGGCDSHIGMGVRYNAEKKKVGNYYSTPIYKFRMKCHLCPNYFEIQTDPKNHDYVIVSGARRKEQRWDPVENEQVAPEDKRTHKKLVTDAMYKLEHGSDDQKKTTSAIPNLNELEHRMGQWKDDYILNKVARDQFREEKKALKMAEESDRELILRSSLSIPLVKEEEEDLKIAGLIKYGTTETYGKKQKEKRKEIELQPFFKTAATGPLFPASASSKEQKLWCARKKLEKSMMMLKTNPFNESPGAKPSTLDVGIRKKLSNRLDDSGECSSDLDSDIGGGSSQAMEIKPVEKSGLGNLMASYADDSSGCDTS